MSFGGRKMEFVRQTINSSQLGQIDLPQNMLNRMVDVIILPATIESELTLDERLEEAFWNCDSEMVELDFDDEGNILVDKDKHPELYDWAVNG